MLAVFFPQSCRGCDVSTVQAERGCRLRIQMTYHAHTIAEKERVVVCQLAFWKEGPIHDEAGPDGVNHAAQPRHLFELAAIRGLIRIVVEHRTANCGAYTVAAYEQVTGCGGAILEM